MTLTKPLPGLDPFVFELRDLHKEGLKKVTERQRAGVGGLQVVEEMTALMDQIVVRAWQHAQRVVTERTGEDLSLIQISQESQGNIEQAIQTVGRAISQLGALQRSTSDASVLSDLQLLDSLQNRYDERASRVRELAESRGDSGPIDLLDQADQLRKESESASQSGNYRMGITLMGQSISLLERAASGS